MECGKEIMALLEGEDDEIEDEVVDGVIRSLERDIISANTAGKLSAPGPPPEEIGCYLPSDSAFSLTSSSVRVSDESVIEYRCGCEGIRTWEKEEKFEYLMEASDEELGLLPPASAVCSGEFDLDNFLEKEWFECEVNGEESFPCYVDTDADLDKLLG